MSKILSKTYIGLHVNYLFFQSQFMILEFSWPIFKSPHVWNFMKIHTVVAKLFYAEGQTDRYDEANSRFMQFFKRVYKCILSMKKFNNINFYALYIS